MGDPKNPRTAPLHLPPGCRFYPSEEELLDYYLTHKNTTALSDDDHHVFGFNVIKEVGIYDYDPFDLPEIACFPYGYGGRRRHWYCYTAKVVKGMGRRWRKAGGGYWKRKGRARDVVGRGVGHVVLGTRTSFVFYLGNSPKSAMRT
ncbi:hypothetical protein L1049_025846 [Liquidambar formosana]|uniref:NAC domain-containing protein n=1 Tax=Liquidambar formosana TaxID=63359 RepID=A0AAP0R6Q6_LIQFO